jgi:molybdopterin-guanine dinucleotide biosynthesis protein MobB
MPPVVSIVGISNSGKTTFLEKVLKELKSKGYRVATVKHTHHDQDFDTPEKDSYRHLRAGSEASLLYSPNGITLVQPIDHELTVEEICRFYGEDYDIILTEGFSRGEAPKIEVHRKERGDLLEVASKRIAVVTDEKLDIKVRQFSLDDAKGVADLLEEGFIKPQKERVVLYVNGSSIPLSDYPRQMMTAITLAMASCLKGVEKVKSLQFFLKRG